MHPARVAGLAAMLLSLMLPGAQAGNATAFTAEERARILQHGPWPPPARNDPSNRVSGQPAAIELGRMLFFERRLSDRARIACASCHQPQRHWSDGLARAVGLAAGDRNTPGVADVRPHRWFGWDGAQDNLWAQSLRPIIDPREMGGSAEGVAALLRADRRLGCLYEQAFGGPPGGASGRRRSVRAAPRAGPRALGPRADPGGREGALDGRAAPAAGSVSD